MFKIASYALGSIQTNAIVVSNPDSKKLWLFDVPENTVDVLERHYAGYEVEAILFTHGHYDHILGWSALVGKTDKVYASAADKDFLVTPQLQAPWMHPLEAALLSPVAITDWVAGGQTLELGELTVKVYDSPGHSLGGLLFELVGLDATVVGDTIFREGVGRADLPGGSWDQLENSIRTQVYTLPDSTVLYPGHGPTTTVGHEKANNPFVVSA